MYSLDKFLISTKLRLMTVIPWDTDTDYGEAFGGEGNSSGDKRFEKISKATEAALSDTANLLITIGVIGIVLTLAWAAVLLIINAGNGRGRAEVKGKLLTAAILLFVLSGLTTIAGAFMKIGENFK